MSAAPPGQIIVTVGTVTLTCNFDPATLAYSSISVVNTGAATTLTVTVLATGIESTFNVRKNATTTVTQAQLNSAGIVFVGDAAVSI